MKKNCRTPRQSFFRLLLVIVCLLILPFVLYQPAFTSQQAFRRLESYYALEHSQILYTDSRDRERIMIPELPTAATDELSRAYLGMDYYEDRDTYIGQAGDIYYFSVLRRKSIYGYSAQSEAREFVAFQMGEGQKMATTLNQNTMIPPFYNYNTMGFTTCGYVAGVVEDPGVARVVLELYGLDDSYAEKTFQPVTLETTEFYNGAFLIYTGYDIASMPWQMYRQVTITAYDQEGEVIERQDAPRKYDGNEGIEIEVLSYSGETALVAFKNTNDYDMEFNPDYKIVYYEPHSWTQYGTEYCRMDAEDQQSLTIPAYETRTYAMRFVNSIADSNYFYNNYTCVMHPAGATHGAEVRFGIFEAAPQTALPEKLPEGPAAEIGEENALLTNEFVIWYT